MQHEPNSQSPGSPAPTAESLDSAALARRRALLKGLSKGGAAVAAVAGAGVAGAVGLPKPPVTTTGNLINVKTGNGMLCTVSGQQSAVMSRSTIVNTCKGFAPSHYVSSAISGPVAVGWPTGVLDGSHKFKHLYPGTTSALANTLLLTILANNSTSNEAYWIAAYFNALLSGPQNLFFPYSTADLQTQYASADPKYLAFYKAFLSSP